MNLNNKQEKPHGASPYEYGKYLGNLFAPSWGPVGDFDAFVKGSIFNYESFRHISDPPIQTSTSRDGSVIVSTSESMWRKYFPDGGPFASYSEFLEFIRGLNEPIANQMGAVVTMEFFSCASLIAQKSGYRFGINLTSMSLRHNGEHVSVQTPVGIHFGLMNEYPLRGRVALQTGFLFSSKGTDYDIDSVYHSLAPAYLEIPVNAAYYIGRNKVKVILFGGPYLSAAFGGYKIGAGR